MANAKPRVHEIASELGVDSKVLLKYLRADGEFMKSPSSTMEWPVARRIRARWPQEGEAFTAALDSPELGTLASRRWSPRAMPEIVDQAVSVLSEVSRSAGSIRLLRSAAADRRFYYLRADALPELDEPVRDEALPPSPSGLAYLDDTRQLLIWARGECLLTSWMSFAAAMPNARVRPVGALQHDAPRLLQRLASVRTRDLAGAPAVASPPTSESSVAGARKRADVVLVYRPTGEGTGHALAAPRQPSDHRWTVRGHHRRQWHPSTKSHETIWIDAHTAGPQDAPLLDVEHVEVF